MRKDGAEHFADKALASPGSTKNPQGLSESELGFNSCAYRLVSGRFASIGEIPSLTTHDKTPLLLLHVLANICSPARAIILQVLHAITHNVKFLRPFIELALHVCPICLVLRVSRRSSCRPTRGTILLFLCTGLSNHALGRWSLRSPN